MRHHVSLFLTASFLFLSQGVQASSIDDDNSSVLQGSGVVQVASTASSATSSTSDDLQCYRKINGQLEPLFDKTGKLLDRRAQEPRSEPTMTSVEKDGKLLWTNVLSGLAHQVRVEIMEWLQDNPRGQLSLMTVSHGFRRLALVMPKRYNDAASTGNALKQRLLTVLIGGQTGDVDLFMKDQLTTFQKLSFQDLQYAFAFRHYGETLSPKTEHGKTYRSIGPGDIKMCSWGKPELSLVRKNLRLVPLNFPEASRIQRLDLVENKLIVAPLLTGLTGLQWLYLSNNQITAAPVLTGLEKLEYLVLSNNQLKVAPDLTGLTNLKWLNLSNNQITAAPVVSGLPKLVWLNLSNNQITTASVATGLTKLEKLDLSNNQIKVLTDVSELPNLQELILSNNQITAAPVLTGLPNLEGLDLSNNQLKVAPDLSVLTKLEKLDLSNNQLNAAPVVSGLTNLMRFLVSNNKLSAAPVVSGLTNLKYLNLSHNQLKVAPDVMGLTALESLYLDSNLCGDLTLLETLRALPKGRSFSFQVDLYAISKDDAGKEVKTLVSLD